MMLYLCVVIVKRERFNTSKNNTSFKVYHIKVDWETHQLLVKYRDKLSQPMAGPIPLVGGIKCPGGLQRRTSTQILSFGVSSHPLMWNL